MAKQPKIYMPKELKAFTFGDPKAEHELVMVSNPFCSPCGRAHHILHEWLRHELDFRITVVFTHQPSQEDPRRQFVEWIAGVEDQQELRQMLHNWFERDDKDLGSWSEEHLLEKTPLPYDDGMLRSWLDTADVQATPTYFVNGYKVPDTYQLEDIRYLISEAIGHR